MRIVIALGLFTLSGVQEPSVVPISDRDAAIYRAVLVHTIQPQVDRFSAGNGIAVPAPILAFDRTIALCETPTSTPPRPGCLGDWTFEPLEGGARVRELAFASQIDARTRSALSSSLRERNRQSSQFPPQQIANVVAFPSEQLDAVLKKEAGRTRGFSGFSLPAYAPDGHALLYATYTCGGLCGYGWLVLLRDGDKGWEVRSVNMLWIS